MKRDRTDGLNDSWYKDRCTKPKTREGVKRPEILTLSSVQIVKRLS